MQNNELQEIRALLAKYTSQIAGIESNIEALHKTLLSIQIDRANYLTNFVNINPNTATKVTFNQYGQITSSDSLSEEDIPPVNITKIKGLQDKLAQFASIDDLKTIIDLINKKTIKGDVAHTGTKVSIDENGNVVEIGKLSEDDIPQIPIEKVNGLTDELEILNKTSEISLTPSVKEDPFTVNPGTGTKITYDGKGRVIGSSNLEENDIPISVLEKIVELSNIINELASASDLNKVEEELSHKLTAIDSTPGTYTKVTINDNGQVVSGSNLTKDDIPKLSTEDIIGLVEYLNNYVKSTDIERIESVVNSNKQNISIIMNTINDQNNSITKIMNEVNTIKQTLSTIISQHDELLKVALGQEVVDEINKLKSINSILAGKITVLEQKILGV